jgi:hypothetical protein
MLIPESKVSIHANFLQRVPSSPLNHDPNPFHFFLFSILHRSVFILIVFCPAVLTAEARQEQAARISSRGQFLHPFPDSYLSFFFPWMVAWFPSSIF